MALKIPLISNVNVHGYVARLFIHTHICTYISKSVKIQYFRLGRHLASYSKLIKKYSIVCTEISAVCKFYGFHGHLHIQ